VGEHDLDQAGTLVREAVVVVPPSGGGEQDVQAGSASSVPIQVGHGEESAENPTDLTKAKGPSAATAVAQVVTYRGLLPPHCNSLDGPIVAPRVGRWTPAISIWCCRSFLNRVKGR
jgi:hypothetical protein